MYQNASPSRCTGLAVAGTALLITALVSGCSSSGSPASGSSTSSVGDSTKTITVGYTNTESSGNSLPEWRYGGQAAINYINAHGGINGTQIKPVFCYVDGSPESSINCANKLIDDHAALDFMGVDVGIDSSLPVLQSAGIPVVGTVGTSTQLTNPDSYVLHGGNGPDVASLAQALKEAGATKTTLIDLSGLGAGATAAFGIAKTVAPRLGMEISELQVPATNTDWTSVIASALADKPNGFILDLSEDGCTNVLQALHAANFKGTTDGPCSDYLKVLGNNAPPTAASTAVWTPDLRQYAPQDIQSRLDIYTSALKAMGHEDVVNSPGASRTFSGWMELAEILRGIKDPINAAAVKSALQGASDVPGYLGPNLHCGKDVWPSEPSVCSAQELLLRIEPSSNGPRRVPIGDAFVDLSNLAS